MADALRGVSQEDDQDRVRKRLCLNGDRHCLFLPGSKPALFRAAIPFYVDLVRHIKERHVDFSAVLLVSPFIGEDLVSDMSAEHGLSDFIVVNNTFSADLCLADLVVTPPGSSTAISAYLGVPVVMLMPLNSPDGILFHGPLRVLLSLPFLNRLTVLVARFVLARRKKWFALINKIASAELVPELVGKFSATAAAEFVSSIFYDISELDRIRIRLAEFNLKRASRYPSRTIVESIMNSGIDEALSDPISQLSE